MPDPGGPWARPQPPPEPPARPARRRRNLLPWLGLLGCAGLGVWGLAVMNPGRLSSGAAWVDVARLFLMLAVVSAGVMSRRFRLAQVLRYGLIWAAVIGVLLLGYSYQDELGSVAARVGSEFVPSEAAATRPHELAVLRDLDDNFYVTAQVNGTPVRFLVDTGSSEIVLSPADARRLGVDVDVLSYPGVYETANGQGRGAPYRAERLAVGDIHFDDVAMSINQAPMATSLLGMTFFKRLDSFEVRGRRLFLRAKP